MYLFLNAWKQLADFKLLVLHSNTWNHFTECEQMINCENHYAYEIDKLETI